MILSKIIQKECLMTKTELLNEEMKAVKDIFESKDDCVDLKDESYILR